MYSHVKQKKRKTKHSKPPSYKTAALPKSKYVQCLVNQRKFLRWNRKSSHSFSNILHYSGCEDLALHEKNNKKKILHTSLELKNTFQFKSLLFQTEKWVENTHAPQRTSCFNAPKQKWELDWPNSVLNPYRTCLSKNQRIFQSISKITWF